MDAFQLFLCCWACDCCLIRRHSVPWNEDAPSYLTAASLNSASARKHFAFQPYWDRIFFFCVIHGVGRNRQGNDYTSILITNFDALIIIHKILFSSTYFEPQVLIFRRIQLYTCSIWYCHSS